MNMHVVRCDLARFNLIAKALACLGGGFFVVFFISTLMSVTPNRKTTVTFDVPDTCLTSPHWGIKRSGGEIGQKAASGQAEALLANNVKLWPTGAWTLAPLQTEISNITEYEIGLNLITVPNNPTLITGLATAGVLFIENSYVYNSDLPGLPASGVGIPSGGPYIVKKIPAGGSWDASIPSGTPSLIGDTPTVTPLDRVGESNDTYPRDQAWFLSWGDTGSALSYPEYTWAFYFGQYGISFSGSGKAKLWELVTYTGNNGAGWILRKEWRYARTGQISGTAHSMAIWPHLGPGGEKYIAFTNGQVDFAEVAASAINTTATATTPGDAVYVAKDDSRYVSTPSGVVTRSGPFRFDIRRDLNLKVQISTLGFPTSGYLVDDPAIIPEVSDQAVFADCNTVCPPNTAIAPTLLDAVSGNVFDSSTDTFPTARFDFSGDGTTTPILWSYRLARNPSSGVYAPGQFSGGNLRNVSIAGYSGDPTQETGTVVIDDVRGELTPLLNRGQASVRVDVSHVENGQTFVTPIFRGYANRPEAERKIKLTSPNRQKFSIPLMGNWLRLAEAVNHGVDDQLFYDDVTVTVPGGPHIPWKATDAITYLLACSGLSPAQIAIPDLPVRLWPGQGQKKDEFVIPSTADYAEMALKIARNYLGLYLYFDLPTGQWTLLQGTPLDAAPLYNFYTGDPGQALGSSAQSIYTTPGSYGPNSTFITDFRSSVIPPEFNCVHVSNGFAQESAKNQNVIERWVYNFQSFQVPGSTNTLDHSNPDFLGRIRETSWIDPSLTGATPAETQANVDWTARRILDFCGHAQRLAHFDAPLVFLLDPVTGQYRMPRFLDPISINGTPWQIKCCAPNYRFDSKQMASYEVIQPQAGQYIPPGVESLSFLRQANRRLAEKAGGHIGQGNRFGLLSTPAHYSSRYRDLPRDISAYYPIQDTNGNFAFMLGFDGLGNAPVQ